MPIDGIENDSDAEDDDHKPFSFTNFMFGNLTEAGTLESDYLDQETKDHLGNLDAQGLNCIGSQILDVKKEVSSGDGETSSSSTNEFSEEEDSAVSFLPSAIDFSDFNEIPEEENYDEELSVKTSISGANECAVDDSSSGATNLAGEYVTSADLDTKPENKPLDYLAANQAVLSSVMSIIGKNLLPVPNSTVASTSPALIVQEPAGEASEISSDAEVSTPPAEVDESDAAKRSLNTPLASVLPPELSNINVNDIFPDFKPDVTLRFSRLFGPGRPSSLPKRWVNYRKETVNAVDAADAEQTDEEEDDELALEKILQQHWPISIKKPAPEVVTIPVAETDAAVSNIPPPEDPIPEKPKRLTSASIPPWRYGPAQHWYDILNVDPTGENFDYGASAKKRDSRSGSSRTTYTSKVPLKLELNDEAYLMVALTEWERNIIWDGADFKREAEKLLADKRTDAGWIPNTTYRTAAAFLSQGKPLDLKNDSMFPAENDELLNGSWEKNIIWDADNIEDLPEPTILTLDPNDPNILLGIPDEEEYETMAQEPVIAQGKEKKDMFKRSRMVLGKAGMLKEPQSPKIHEEPKNQWKDPFNLSNDEYYTPKADENNLKTTTGAVAIQHSIPAVQLYHYFFPTNFNQVRLQQFHRTALKKYSNGIIIQPGPHPVESLNKTIKKREKQRVQELVASGGGEMFYMRTPEDLSAMDGEMILAEYSEEHPPLMSQIGMATRIKNYYKRKPGKNDEEMPKFDLGELALAHTSPFLGTLQPGQWLRALENNMFRAPIYEQSMPSTDFLVIRTRNRYHIRDIRIIFTVGQECPLIEVPAPNSKKATNFLRDFLQAHIHRLFWKSTDLPRRIKTEDVKKLFGTLGESTIRKRLKICAEFQRSGQDSQWWILRNEYRLPAEEEIRSSFTPEDYCAYYSMKSAEQRLKDAGYGEKLMLALEDDGDEEQQSKMDDEIKAAPWHTTRAFITAMKNKCILQLTGDADPTGRGEGFSYVKIPSKTQEKDGPAPVKRIVTGTDADLRKLSLNHAKQLLRKYGCHDDQIKKLTRWEIVDLVRTLGTQQARSGAEEAMSKFARGNRYSAAEQQEKYRDDCQRLFELQNRVLSSGEILSTDEESSEEEEDSDLEELGRNLDSFIQSKKSSKELLFEREEEERKELKKLLNQEEAQNIIQQKKKRGKVGKKKNAAVEEPVDEGIAQPVRKLKIVRTFRDADGRDFDRTEYVSRAPLIEAYVRIRTTTDSEFIRQFAAHDSERKEAVRKEKRRIQEQLRRLNRIENGADKPSPEASSKKKLKKEPSQLKVRCGACGGIGHMRTNKVCPMAGDVINVAMTKEQEELQLGRAVEESGQVKTEGSKIIISKEILNQAEQVRRDSLIIKIPKQLADVRALNKLEKGYGKKERKEREEMEGESSSSSRRKKMRLESLPDYLEKPRQTTARRRIDPVVSLSSILEDILNEIRELPGCEPFRVPVSIKSCPDYLQHVNKPMDLSTIRSNLHHGKYRSREDFLADINQTVQNCAAYNGPNSVLTTNAKKMLDTCLQRFGEREERFKRLEKLINPLLDDDDQVALSYLLQQIISQLRSIEGSMPFHTPVNRKTIKDYYEVIRNPMDFETMSQKAKSHMYQTSEQFLNDVETVRSNCVQYNGKDSQYSQTAEEIVRTARKAISQEAERIAGLEAAIRIIQEAAADAAETESVGTGISEPDTKPKSKRGRKRRIPSFADVEESTRASALSDPGEDERLRDLTVSPDISIHGDDSSDRTRDAPFPVDVHLDDVEVVDEETTSGTIDNESPPMKKKQLRLPMGNTYYDDARTGYDSDHGGDTPIEKVRAEEPPSPHSALTAPASLAALQEDLHVSDSDSEKEEKPAEKSGSVAADDDDDGLWF